MKINRLFETIYILLDKKRVTAKELADHFEVSTRTIYRDVEDLSSSGIPISMSKGKNGGIFLLPHYVLNKAILTDDEKTGILSALQSFNALDEASVEGILSKLSSFFGEKSTGFFDIDYSDWGNLIKEPFEKSKEAILSRKLLCFDYISSQNLRSRRIVEPYKLWFKERTWYLKAFCLEKNAIRIFRFSRMRKVEIKEEPFIPRALNFSVYDEHKPPFPTTEIVLRVEKDAEHRILDEFSEQDVIQNEDGSFTVTMNFIQNDWVYGYILSFGASATVLKPEKIKNHIRQLLKKSLENYS